jgi:hypothetical protein
MVQPQRVNLGKGPVVMCSGCVDSAFKDARPSLDALTERVMADLGLKKTGNGWSSAPPAPAPSALGKSP